MAPPTDAKTLGRLLRLSGTDDIALAMAVVARCCAFLLRRPTIALRQFDELVAEMNEAVYYAREDGVRVFLEHLPAVVDAADVFIVRHLAGLLRAVAVHVLQHPTPVARVLQKAVATVPLLPAIRRDCVLMAYVLFVHHADTEVVKDILAKVTRQDQQVVTETLAPMLTTVDEQFLRLV